LSHHICIGPQGEKRKGERKIPGKSHHTDPLAAEEPGRKKKKKKKRGDSSCPSHSLTSPNLRKEAKEEGEFPHAVTILQRSIHLQNQGLKKRKKKRKGEGGRKTDTGTVLIPQLNRHHLRGKLEKKKGKKKKKKTSSLLSTTPLQGDHVLSPCPEKKGGSSEDAVYYMLISHSSLGQALG